MTAGSVVAGDSAEIRVDLNEGLYAIGALLLALSIVFAAGSALVGREFYASFKQQRAQAAAPIASNVTPAALKSLERERASNAAASRAAAVACWFFGLILCASVGAAIALVLKRRRLLVVDRSSIRFETAIEGFALPLTAIRSIHFLPRLIGPVGAAAGHAGAYVLESRDGRSGTFRVGRNVKSSSLPRLLSRIEAATSLPWSGREQRVEFRAYVRLLRDASGAKSLAGFALWIGRMSLWPRKTWIGLFDPAARRSFEIASAAFVGPLALLVGAGFGLAASGVDSEFRVPSGFLLVPAPQFIAGIAFAWAFAAFGLNSLVIVAGLQQRRRDAIEAELNAAREVQRKLLPASVPSLPGFDIAADCFPAQEVGGDYYDFFSHADELTIPIADVSGKGISAGLLMTLTKGALVTQLQGGASVIRILGSVNQAIRASSESRMFVSMAVARLHAAEREISILRAGHNPPLLIRRTGAPSWITPPGLALGLGGAALFDSVTREERIALDPGDVLVLYTDGVTEAMNSTSEEFGEVRLASTVSAHREESAGGIRDAIVDAVKAFRSGAPPNDDLTLVIVRAT